MIAKGPPKRQYYPSGPLLPTTLGPLIIGHDTLCRESLPRLMKPFYNFRFWGGSLIVPFSQQVRSFFLRMRTFCGRSFRASLKAGQANHSMWDPIGCPGTRQAEMMWRWSGGLCGLGCLGLPFACSGLLASGEERHAEAVVLRWSLDNTR